jgi:hypothetical protein
MSQGRQTLSNPEPSNNDRDTENSRSDIKSTVALIKRELKDEVNRELDEFFKKIEEVAVENESKPERDLYNNLLVPMLEIKFKKLALERRRRMVGGSIDTLSPCEIIEEFMERRRERNVDLKQRNTGFRELDDANLWERILSHFLERILSQSRTEPLNAWRHLDKYMTDIGEGEETAQD